MKNEDWAKRNYRPTFWAMISAPLAASCVLLGSCETKPIQIAVSPISEPTVTGVLIGTISVRNGCVYLKSGRSLRLIIWPSNAAVSPDGSIIASGIAIRNGDFVRVLGGEISADAFSSDSDIAHLAATCKSQIVLISDIVKEKE